MCSTDLVTLSHYLTSMVVGSGSSKPSLKGPDGSGLREGRNKEWLGLLSCPDRASSGGKQSGEIRKHFLDISMLTCFRDRQKKARELQRPYIGGVWEARLKGSRQSLR